MSQYLPGLREEGEVDVFAFDRPRRVFTVNWWWKPVCWVLRRPTRIVR